MADEKAPGQQEQKKSSSIIVKLLIIGGASVLIPAISAVLVFLFVLKPMLVADKEGGEASNSVVVDSSDTIPPTAVIVKFDEAQATVITQRPDSPAPLLIYQVAMSCSDQNVSTVIDSKKEYFTALINKIHRNRTRTELNDPGVQEALLRQIKNEANQLLNKLSPGIKGGILEVMYLKYTIVDL